MDTMKMDGTAFLGMVRQGAARLNAHRKEVNDLNVFPIPDGDTGDNMFMTIDAGCTAAAGEGSALAAAADAVSRGMLLGARGNSGVILSRIFAGIAKGLAGLDRADVPAFAAAMSSGVREAYGAVSVPVEGTILTVLKDGVRVAGQRTDTTFTDYFDRLVAEFGASLDRTPDLLDVLKEAGVVDSGGAGLLCIAEGMCDALYGITEGPAEDRPVAQKALDLDAFTTDSELTYGYCTEFLLRLQRAKGDPDAFDLDGLIAYLGGIGDSVVAFRDGTAVKVHVHTRTPGEVLNHCQRYGEFLTVKVENMTLQHHETTIRNHFRRARKPYGVVTVAAGAGLVETFRSLGADAVIEGGQTMNPSVQDFLDAFVGIEADTVLVLPNNANIILTARQAAELCPGTDIRVLPSRTIGEGYAALAAFDPTGAPDAVMAAMEEVIGGVVTGLVSRAIRDSGDVHEGDWIGFSDGEVLASAPDRGDAVKGLCDRLGAGEHDVVLVFSGEGVDGAEAGRLCRSLGETWRRTEFILSTGGQPVYDYIIVLC